MNEDLEQKLEQGDISKKVKKPYTQLALACCGIAAAVIILFVFSTTLSNFRTTSKGVMQDSVVGLAGKAGEQMVQCEQTDNCDTCLDLPPGKMCDCREECRTGICEEGFCRTK